MKVKIIGLLAAVILVAALVAVASGATGAYFSDTKNGNVDGTIGTVKVDTTDMNIHFANLMPGEPQTVQVNFANSGSSAQDIWVVFPQADALHAINDLGTYGMVTVANADGDLFYSNNLNDRPNNGTTPLPVKIKLASSLAPGAGNAFKFTFAYASKLGDASTTPGQTHPASSGGGVWNVWPLVDLTYYHNDSGFVVGSHAGLPFNIVATQVGQQP
jgi:hypothetical protein